LGGKPPVETVGSGEGPLSWAPECQVGCRQPVAGSDLQVFFWVFSEELPLNEKAAIVFGLMFILFLLRRFDVH